MSYVCEYCGFIGSDLELYLIEFDMLVDFEWQPDGLEAHFCSVGHAHKMIEEDSEFSNVRVTKQ